MDRRGHPRCHRRSGRVRPWGGWGFQEEASVSGDPELAAQQGLRSGCPESDDHLWVDDHQFGLQPRAARCDLIRGRSLVDAPLPSRLELEVLDHVGDVDVVAIDPRFIQGLVEDRTRRTDERPAGEVLSIARLLADHHHSGLPRAFPGDRLGCASVKPAGPAFLDRLAELRQRWAIGDDVPGCSLSSSGIRHR